MEYSIRLQLAKMPRRYTELYEELRLFMGKAAAFAKVKQMYGLEKTVCLIG
jgi:hypothetical protein